MLVVVQQHWTLLEKQANIHNIFKIIFLIHIPLHDGR
jgi:hypothetical protein